MKVIAAGVGKNQKIIEAAQSVKFPVKLFDNEKQLMEMISNPQVGAVVRGSLDSSIISSIKKEYGNNIIRASFIKIKDHEFLLAPVGIDEGKNLEEKALMVELCCEFLKSMGKRPQVAIISGGRSQDVGRSPQIDQSIEEGKHLTSIIKDKYRVKHYYILIEKALQDRCNLILAPDGISGNLIFRSLVLIGSLKSYGAVTLGMNKIFIDTSRDQSKSGYIRALNFAHHLARRDKCTL
ncbi:methanogenesis marker protein Mmp4/MtxX [Methanobacterium movens]